MSRRRSPLEWLLRVRLPDALPEPPAAAPASGASAGHLPRDPVDVAVAELRETVEATEAMLRRLVRVTGDVREIQARGTDPLGMRRAEERAVGGLTIRQHHVKLLSEAEEAIDELLQQLVRRREEVLAALEGRTGFRDAVQKAAADDATRRSVLLAVVVVEALDESNAQLRHITADPGTYRAPDRPPIRVKTAKDKDFWRVYLKTALQPGNTTAFPAIALPYVVAFAWWVNAHMVKVESEDPGFDHIYELRLTNLDSKNWGYQQPAPALLAPSFGMPLPFAHSGHFTWYLRPTAEYTGLRIDHAAILEQLPFLFGEFEPFVRNISVAPIRFGHRVNDGPFSLVPLPPRAVQGAEEFRFSWLRQVALMSLGITADVGLAIGVQLPDGTRLDLGVGPALQFYPHLAPEAPFLRLEGQMFWPKVPLTLALPHWPAVSLSLNGTRLLIDTARGSNVRVHRNTRRFQDDQRIVAKLFYEAEVNGRTLADDLRERLAALPSPDVPPDLTGAFPGGFVRSFYRRRAALRPYLQGLFRTLLEGDIVDTVPAAQQATLRYVLTNLGNLELPRYLRRDVLEEFEAFVAQRIYERLQAIHHDLLHPPEAYTWLTLAERERVLEMAAWSRNRAVAQFVTFLDVRMMEVESRPFLHNMLAPIVETTLLNALLATAFNDLYRDYVRRLVRAPKTAVGQSLRAHISRLDFFEQMMTTSARNLQPDQAGAALWEERLEKRTRLLERLLRIDLGRVEKLQRRKHRVTLRILDVDGQIASQPGAGAARAAQRADLRRRQVSLIDEINLLQAEIADVSARLGRPVRVPGSAPVTRMPISMDEIRALKPLPAGAGPMGTNPSRWYQDARTGAAYLVKELPTADHGFVTMAVAEAYRLFGEAVLRETRPSVVIPTEVVIRDRRTHHWYLVSAAVPNVEIPPPAWWNGLAGQAARAAFAGYLPVLTLFSDDDRFPRAGTNTPVAQGAAGSVVVAITDMQAARFHASGALRDSWSPTQPWLDPLVAAGFPISGHKPLQGPGPLDGARDAEALAAGLLELRDRFPLQRWLAYLGWLRAQGMSDEAQRALADTVTARLDQAFDVAAKLRAGVLTYLRRQASNRAHDREQARQTEIATMQASIHESAIRLHEVTARFVTPAPGQPKRPQRPPTPRTAGSRALVGTPQAVRRLAAALHDVQRGVGAVEEEVVQVLLATTEVADLLDIGGIVGRRRALDARTAHLVLVRDRLAASRHELLARLDAALASVQQAEAAPLPSLHDIADDLNRLRVGLAGSAASIIASSTSLSDMAAELLNGRDELRRTVDDMVIALAQGGHPLVPVEATAPDLPAATLPFDVRWLPSMLSEVQTDWRRMTQAAGLDEVDQLAGPGVAHLRRREIEQAHRRVVAIRTGYEFSVAVLRSHVQDALALIDQARVEAGDSDLLVSASRALRTYDTIVNEMAVVTYTRFDNAQKLLSALRRRAPETSRTETAGESAKMPGRPDLSALAAAASQTVAAWNRAQHLTGAFRRLLNDIVLVRSAGDLVGHLRVIGFNAFPVLSQRLAEQPEIAPTLDALHAAVMARHGAADAAESALRRQLRDAAVWPATVTASAGGATPAPELDEGASGASESWGRWCATRLTEERAATDILRREFIATVVRLRDLARMPPETAPDRPSPQPASSPGPASRKTGLIRNPLPFP